MADGYEEKEQLTSHIAMTTTGYNKQYNGTLIETSMNKGQQISIKGENQQKAEI